MHKRVQKLLIAVACLALAACRTPLERPAGARSITEGVTTYEQVVKSFGKPDAEMRGSDGQRLVSYYETRARRSFDSAMFGVFAKNQGQVEFRHLDIVLTWMYARVGTFGAGDTQVLAVILDKNEKVDDYRIQERAR